VREHRELPVQQAARAQAPDRTCHARTTHTIEPGLRTVFGSQKFDRLRRRGRKLMLRERLKFTPCRKHLLTRGRSVQLERNPLGVTVFHGNPIAVRAHARAERLDFVSFETAEQLVNERLGEIMVNSFQSVLSLSKQHKVNMRTAAYMVSINRVAQVHRLRGIYA